MLKRILVFFVCIILTISLGQGFMPTKIEAKSKVKMHTIVDMAGRKVSIPVNIKKAFSTSQIGIITIYTINPEKLAGWGFKLIPQEKKYISPKCYNLPVLGTWSGKNGTGNIEEIIKAHPDVMISMGTVTKAEIDASEKIQKQTGIPIVMVDGSLTKLDKAYEFIGNLMNEKKKAKELGDYCKKTISDIQKQVAKIPKNSKKKVYYAEGLEGLETDPKGSFHTEVLDFVGGINIAEVSTKSGYGRAQVSMEQLLAWNPDVIITGYDKDIAGGAYKHILTDESFKGLKAVKNHKVYQIPSIPYDWFDRPPSVNRIIGVKWLANLLYPNYVKMDIKKEVVTFYDKFYHYKLSTKEVKELLSNAITN